MALKLRGDTIINECGKTLLELNESISGNTTNITSLTTKVNGMEAPVNRYKSGFEEWYTQNVDANTLTQTGIYYLGSSSSNVPASWVKIIVMAQDRKELSSGDTVQIAIQVNTNPRMWIRARNGSTWYDWVPVATQSHPVGSVVITSTNDKSILSNNFGGTWELIDKEFKPYRIEDNQDKATVFTMGSSSSYAMSVNIAGHTIDISGWFVNSVALTDSSITIGTFKPEALGLSDFTGLYRRTTAYSDGGNSVVYLNMNTAGTFRSADVNYSLTSVAKGNQWDFGISMTIGDHNQMLDSACNKFYWKRTA